MMGRLLRRLQHLLRQRQRGADLAEEMDFHRAMKRQELERAGVDRGAAELATRRQLGSMALAKDRARDVWLSVWLQGLGEDVRFGARMLRSTPLVSTVAVLSLSLGIGANTAIFSLINSLILRPLPRVIEPERLVTLSSGTASRWSYAFWKEIEKRSQNLGGAVAWSNSGFDVSIGNEVERVDGALVSGDFFKTLGVTPVIGRLLGASDDVRGGSPQGPAVVISERVWRARFARAPDVLGRSLTINRAPFTIVGITPPGFFGTEVGRVFDVVVPLATEPLVRGSQTSLTPPEDRFNQWLTVARRLTPGESIDAATAAVRSVQSQIREDARPPSRADFIKEPFTLTPIAAGTSTLRRLYQRPLLVILLVVALVLFVACANIANLQLARASARRHELSVRRALGAAGWRLTRQMLIESLTLAVIGATGGVALASWASKLLVAQMSTSVYPIVLDSPLDWRVLGFTAAVATTTAILFAVVPALQAARVSPMDVMKARSITREGRNGLSGSLVVLQVSVSLVVVVFAGLFVGTFQQLASRPRGFDADRVLVVQVDTAHSAVQPSGRMALFDRLVAAASSAPGVAHAAGSMSTPVDGSSGNAFVHVEGTPREPTTPRASARWTFVTPAWFSTYGVPLRAGRDVNPRDASGASPVVVVNQRFVERFLSRRAAIGTAIEVTGGDGKTVFGTMTIIGVVGDAIYSSLREPLQPTMYFPLAQWFLPNPMNFALKIGVRSAQIAPAALAATINAALTPVDSSLIIGFRTLDAQVRDSLRQEQLLATLSGVFAILALLLAALGLYGVTAYAVTRRRTEIGVRLALGAGQGSIVWVAVARVALLVGIGLAIGTVASIGLSRFVAALLYGLEPQDPEILVGATVVLITVAALAGGLPAWRASRIDPAVVLREQ